jgi:hypothetical protein
MPALESLIRRFRFDPRKPRDTTTTRGKTFFGETRATFNERALQTQYNAFVDSWTTRTPDVWATTSSYDFWMSKLAVWPELTKVALWWSAYPTSSISCERVFGAARSIDHQFRKYA